MVRHRRIGQMAEQIAYCIETGGVMFCKSQQQADRLMKDNPGLKTLVKSEERLLGSPIDMNLVDWDAMRKQWAEEEDSWNGDNL